MVAYAFKDPERTQSITAKEALTANHQTRYYCPNPACRAELYICQRNGNHDGYFSANRKGRGHDQQCPYSSSYNFDSKEYNEAAFTFDKAIKQMQRVLLPSATTRLPTDRHIVKLDNRSTQKTPRTLNEIYSMCKQLPPCETYNGYLIGDMLFDNRSAKMHINGPCGPMLVEVFRDKHSLFYFPTALEFRFRTASNDRLLISVSDRGVFTQLKKSIFNNKNSILVLAGVWTFNRTSQKSSSRTSCLVLRSKKQYMFINH